MQSNKRLNAVWAKTNGICAHCGRRAMGNNRTSDHYVPRSRGGGYDIRNLLPLCKQCNMSRGNNPISPATYYKFAPRDQINACIQYEREFLNSRRSMDGEVY